MCAGSFNAAKLVLEHNVRPGVKLAVTGGGKCNFTHLPTLPKDYICQNKHFCKSALAAFKPQDFISLLKTEQLIFTEKEPGQLFAQNAKDIVHLLERRAKKANTSFLYNTQALNITQENGLFCVRTSKGNFYANHLVIATGGLSYPALGATGFAYQAAKELGLSVTPRQPALTSLHLPHPWRNRCRSLAGNSCPAEVSVQKHTERGALLFTHEGFSGPAIMQSSLYWQEGEEVRINFLPDINVEAFLREHKNEPALFSKILADILPPKITKILLGDLDVRAADANKETLRQAAERLNAFCFIPRSTGGYTHAEVTVGGVDTSAFQASTMECKNIPGLFFIGEALDVTGRLGGYNLHWAWASAACAAKALSQR